MPTPEPMIAAASASCLWRVAAERATPADVTLGAASD
jgi:hypothetical protein